MQIDGSFQTNRMWKQVTRTGEGPEQEQVPTAQLGVREQMALKRNEAQNQSPPRPTFPCHPGRE